MVLGHHEEWMRPANGKYRVHRPLWPLLKMTGSSLFLSFGWKSNTNQQQRIFQHWFFQPNNNVISLWWSEEKSSLNSPYHQSSINQQQDRQEPRWSEAMRGRYARWRKRLWVQHEQEEQCASSQCAAAKVVSTCKKENERDRILYIAIRLTQIVDARSSCEIADSKTGSIFSDTVNRNSSVVVAQSLLALCQEEHRRILIEL